MCVEVLLVYPGASYLLHQQSYRAGRSGFKSSHSYKLSVFFVFFFPLLFFAPACLSQSSDSIFARASPSTSCVEDRAVKCHALQGFLYTHTHTPYTYMQTGRVPFVPESLDTLPLSCPLLSRSLWLAPKWPRPGATGGRDPASLQGDSFHSNAPLFWHFSHSPLYRLLEMSHPCSSSFLSSALNYLSSYSFLNSVLPQISLSLSLSLSVLPFFCFQNFSPLGTPAGTSHISSFNIPPR